MINWQNSRTLFTMLFLAALTFMAVSPILADGDDATVNMYSEDSENGNNEDAAVSEASASSETADIVETPEPEAVLPEPRELFGGNLHKVSTSRSDLTYSWALAMVKAEEVIETLKSIFAKPISDGQINLVDNRAGNAIVAVFPDKKDVATRKEWADVMGVIDGPVDQVLIEVNIFELILNDIEQKGGQLRAFAEVAAGGQDLFQTMNLSHSANTMEAEEKGIEGFKYYVSNGDKLKALLFSGKDRNKTKLLSSPMMIASNHKPANFKLGQTVPVLTGTTIANDVTNYSFEHKDVGINIHLTPHFCGEGYVNIDINQEVNDLVQYDDVKKVAVFAHKTLTSNVTMRSGETVALGGYIHNKNRLSRKNSPALRKIPFIGKYLNRDIDTNERAEVVVFITPKILVNNSQTKFNKYADNKRLTRRMDMISKLDKGFDDSDIGTRSREREQKAADQKAADRKKKAAKKSLDKSLKQSAVGKPASDKTIDKKVLIRQAAAKKYAARKAAIKKAIAVENAAKEKATVKAADNNV